jgi:hypothetical protein
MASKFDHITALAAVVRQTHNCDAVHCETVLVHETMDGQTVWKGDVEVFELSGHAEAKKCYAWLYQDDENRARHVTVLDKHAVNSPKMAVRSAIFFNVQPAPYSPSNHCAEESPNSSPAME